MSTLYAYGKVKPKLRYYGLSSEKAIEIMDWYISNYDSDEFNEFGIFETFHVRLKAEMEWCDEYWSEYSGTYSVEFKGCLHEGDINHLTYDRTMEQLRLLSKLIKQKFELE